MDGILPCNCQCERHFDKNFQCNGWDTVTRGDHELLGRRTGKERLSHFSEMNRTEFSIRLRRKALILPIWRLVLKEHIINNRNIKLQPQHYIKLWRIPELSMLHYKQVEDMVNQVPHLARIL